MNMITEDFKQNIAMIQVFVSQGWYINMRAALEAQVNDSILSTTDQATSRH